MIREFLCKIKWHSIDRDYTHTKEGDELNFQNHSRCKWCGYEGMIDSQGNLF